MPNHIRADYDAATIVVYQAYPAAIATPALVANRFVSPFSMHRMTWIKPSFLWLMERSNWGQKTGQEKILAVRITRTGFDEALSLGVLTHPDSAVYRDANDWQTRFDAATVHMQWDPERSLRGAPLATGSIQIGISRHIIERFVDEWTWSITDHTPRVRKMHDFLKRGQAENAKRLLPPERFYPVADETARRIGIVSK